MTFSTRTPKNTKQLQIPRNQNQPNRSIDQLQTQKPYKLTNQTKKSKNPIIHNQLQIRQNQLKRTHI